MDFDEHLARARLRRWNLFELHHARRAELADHNRFQRKPPGTFLSMILSENWRLLFGIMLAWDKAAPCRSGQAPPRYLGAESSGRRLAALRIRAISEESSRMNCTSASGVPSATV